MNRYALCGTACAFRSKNAIAVVCRLCCFFDELFDLFILTVCVAAFPSAGNPPLLPPCCTLRPSLAAGSSSATPPPTSGAELASSGPTRTRQICAASLVQKMLSCKGFLLAAGRRSSGCSQNSRPSAANSFTKVRWACSPCWRPRGLKLMLCLASEARVGRGGRS